MRAVVRRSGKLICDDIEELDPGPGQVRVKTLACGICGSDLHALHHLDHMVAMGKRSGGGGDLDPAKDIVFGHEFCGEVLEGGPGATRFKAGTRVVSMPVNMSPTSFDAVGYSNKYPGGFAERMILTEMLLLEVPNGLSTEHAALTEPMAVGDHAVASAALDKNSVALVIGCGPVGLAVIAALKVRGHGPIIAADFSPRRRKAAEAMGADVIIDPAVEGPHTKWADFGVPMTGEAMRAALFSGAQGGRPVVFECVGAPGVLQSVIEGCPTKAQIIVAGVCMEADRIEPSLCINKQLDMRFVLGYAPDEFAQSLFNIAEGKINVEPWITSTVGLDGVAQAFEDLGNPEGNVKILVKPNG
ncbi:MAG: zinc-binding dehydrogenase [Caulobacter sp.]|jgi:threonine dehydrogenase-like Zn-dependent dehydrogenase|nr:zinc-binding dehydrogenase [Caulobacter sp.]